MYIYTYSNNIRKHTYSYKDIYTYLRQTKIQISPRGCMSFCNYIIPREYMSCLDRRRYVAWTYVVHVICYIVEFFSVHVRSLLFGGNQLMVPVHHQK